MNKLKKIISVWIILSLAFWNLTFSTSNADYNSSDLEYNISNISYLLTDWELEKLDWLLNNLDKNLSKLNNQEKISQLKKVKVKLWLLLKKQKKSKSINQLKYLDLKLDLMIFDLQTASKYNSDTNLTSEEITKVDDAIVDLQLNLLDNSKSLTDKLTKEFQKVANYSETWSWKLELNLSKEALWKANALLNMPNYNIKKSNFDQQINWDINFSWNYDSLYWSGDISLKTFIDMISKDWDIYMMLKNSDFKVSNENIQTYLDQIKTKFKDWKYVLIPQTDEAKNIYKYLNNFDLESSFSASKTILEKPLVKAYKKDWDKYYLVPTKYACQTYFDIKNKINPGLISTCSDTIYSAFLREFSNSWDFYITLWEDKNTIWYEYFDKKTEVKVISNLDYTKTEIKNFYLKMISNNKSNKWDDLEINYVKNDHFNVNFIYNKDNEKLNFVSKLDSENNMISAKWIINFDNNLIWNYSLDNWNISWDFVYTWKNYDYESWNYSKSYVVAWKLAWNAKIYNLSVKWVDYKTKKAFLDSSLNYNNWSWDFSLTYDDYSIFKLNWTYKVWENYMKVDSKYETIMWKETYLWNLNFEINQTNNKNNQNLFFDVNDKAEQLVKLNYSNTWNRVYQKPTITAPTDYTTIDTWSSLNDY